jgi:hypothetical protein
MLPCIMYPPLQVRRLPAQSDAIPGMQYYLQDDLPLLLEQSDYVYVLRSALPSLAARGGGGGGGGGGAPPPPPCC